MSTADGRGEPLQSPILLDPARAVQDIKLSGRAIKERWPMTPRKLKGIVERLYHIVRTKEVTIPVKDGVFDSKSEANKTAVAAARVLVSIAAQNQSDEHLEFKANLTKPLSGGDTYYIGQAIHDARQFLTADPEYIEFLRERAAREDGYASTPGPILQPGALEAGETPPVDRP